MCVINIISVITIKFNIYILNLIVITLIILITHITINI